MTDPEYEFERNQLIKTAELFADAKVPLIVDSKKGDGSLIPNRNDPSWNRLYFRMMDHLAFQKGLQSAYLHKQE